MNCDSTELKRSSIFFYYFFFLLPNGIAGRKLVKRRLTRTSGQECSITLRIDFKILNSNKEKKINCEISLKSFKYFFFIKIIFISHLLVYFASCRVLTPVIIIQACTRKMEFLFQALSGTFLTVDRLSVPKTA